MSKTSPLNTLYGGAITAGAAIGAGMFAIPIAAAQLGFVLTLVAMLIVAVMTLMAAHLIAGIGLQFAPGTSFGSYIGTTLGRNAQLAAGFAIIVLLYTLQYAYFTGFGGAVSVAFNAPEITQQAWLRPIPALVLVIVVALGGRIVGYTSSLLIAIMLGSFLLVSGGYVSVVQGQSLTTVPDAAEGFLPFMLLLPFLVTAFGCAPVIPSLIATYGANRTAILRAVWFGIAGAFVFYTAWITIAFGVLSEQVLTDIQASGEGLPALLLAMEQQTGTAVPAAVLQTFTLCAIASSFLAAALTTADYLGDGLRSLLNVHSRSLALLLAVVPPALGSALWPYGFVPAIAFAGLITLFAFYIVPVFVSRRLPGTTRWNTTQLLVIVSAVLILAMEAWQQLR